MSKKTLLEAGKTPAGYAGIHSGIVELHDAARQAAARSVNALMTASYWEIGHRIVEAEQQGRRRASHGEQLIERLSADLTVQFGRGFGVNNLENMRRFFLAYPRSAISQTVSGKLDLAELALAFTLPWSAYVRLLSVGDVHARQFYETEALRGGWSVRQLDRQINSQFYERTALSKNKAAMLVKGAVPKPEDAITPGDTIKDPYVLEFLDLKDEYSESDLENALIQRLEGFLLELAPINTGSTIRRPARRGLSTFTPIHLHSYREWQQLRGGHDRVKELTIKGSVSNIDAHMVGCHAFPHLDPDYKPGS